MFSLESRALRRHFADARGPLTRIISWVVRISTRISSEVHVSTDQAHVPSGGNNPGLAAFRGYLLELDS